MSKEKPYQRVPNQLRLQKIHEQGCQCALCGGIFKPYQLQAHHIEGFAQGGSSVDPNNIGIVCKPCHDIADRRWQEAGVSLHQLIEESGGCLPAPAVLVRR